MYENNPTLIEMYARCLVESRLQSARMRTASPSTVVLVVGRLAAGLRRLATAVEKWANGNVDNVLATRHADPVA